MNDSSEINMCTDDEVYEAVVFDQQCFGSVIIIRANSQRDLLPPPLLIVRSIYLLIFIAIVVDSLNLFTRYYFIHVYANFSTFWVTDHC